MAKDLKQDLHVLIIGAGPSGLLIAQGLKQAGISHSIYERATPSTYLNRERDWTMALHWGTSFLETLLPPSVQARVATEAETDPGIELTDTQAKFTPVYNGKTAELVFNVPTATSRRVSRARLLKLLSDGVDVTYGCRLVGLEDDGNFVTAKFEDGRTARGNLLVGCDSINGPVRTYLLGEEKAKLEPYPVIVYNFICKYTAEQAIYIRNSLHPLQKNAIHPDTSTWYILAIHSIPDPDDPSSWTFQHFFNLWIDNDEKVPEGQAERLAHFKSVTSQHGEPWYSASRWVPDDTFIPVDKIRYWPNPSKWGNHDGRISLAGDAAHPMVPYRGQGLNHAVQDAALYVQALVKALEEVNSGTPLGAAIRKTINEYDIEVVERGSQEIKMSAEQGFRSMHFNEFMTSPLLKLGLNKHS